MGVREEDKGNMNEPDYRIENGRKIYTMDTTIGCSRRPLIDNNIVGRVVPDDKNDGGHRPPYESK